MTFLRLLASALLLPCELSEGQCEFAKPVTEAGVRYTDGRRYDGAAPTFSVGEAGSRYVRVNVRLDRGGDGPWLLMVRDSNGHLVETMSDADFPQNASRWTHRIDGAHAWFELVKSPQASQTTVVFDYFIAMSANTKGMYYSLQGPVPRYVPLYSKDVMMPARKLGDHVGLLMTSSGGNGKPAWFCSGVMVSATLFLTNWHCGAPPGSASDDYWTATVLNEALVDLSWDDDRVSNEYLVSGLVSCSIDLDYALLRVKAIGGLGPARGASVRLSQASSGESVSLVHHPLGAQKQISFCNVIKRNYSSWLENRADIDFTHPCDTEAGSSGAPLFDADGRLVGLHHRGFDFDDHCNRKDKENKAVQIGRILSDLSPATRSEIRLVP